MDLKCTLTVASTGLCEAGFKKGGQSHRGSCVRLLDNRWAAVARPVLLLIPDPGLSDSFAARRVSPSRPRESVADLRITPEVIAPLSPSMAYPAPQTAVDIQSHIVKLSVYHPHYHHGSAAATRIPLFRKILNPGAGP